MAQGSGDFSIGSRHWPGLSKAIEEAGEFLQVAGKLIATAGQVEHREGKPLHERLEDEIGDLQAALTFFVRTNSAFLRTEVLIARMAKKLALFEAWHAAGDPLPSTVLCPGTPGASSWGRCEKRKDHPPPCTHDPPPSTVAGHKRIHEPDLDGCCESCGLLLGFTHTHTSVDCVRELRAYVASLTEGVRECEGDGGCRATQHVRDRPGKYLQARP